MKTRVRKSHAINANKRLPQGLGELLVQEVLALPGCPKTDYLKTEFLSKFVSKDTDPKEVTRARAIEKWLSVERDNILTNERFLNTHSDFQILPDVEMQDFVTWLQATVIDIIGETVPEEALIGSFSGGASTSRGRTSSHPARKYIGISHVTREAEPLWELALEMMPFWGRYFETHASSVHVVPGNVMFTVPKTTLIDRVACKEPDINMFLQKGAGNVLRRCLRNRGIDLNDQSRNRSLAYEGSLTGALATIDLSSASDCVTTGLVELALPPLWFSHLNSLRCKVTNIDGEEHVNEMFSSMGNGFTFELESLLFYALARTTAYFTGTRGVISVYGDDLIVPTDLYRPLEWVLSYFGFKVNSKKSFSEGPFRESCGGHYTGGLDITPFYVREPIETLSDLIKFANALRRWSESSVGVNDPTVYPLWEFAASFVPKRFWGSVDHATRYQLYAPSQAHSRLHAEVKDWYTGEGGLIHWFNSTYRRSPCEAYCPVPGSDYVSLWTREALREQHVSTSEASLELESGRSGGSVRMVTRRARRTVGIRIPRFPQELLSS